MQQLLTASVTIQVPSDHVLISRAEYKELKEHELSGAYWNMSDLEKKTNRKNEWIKKHILYPQRFKQILDVDFGGFVFYPKSQGQPWSFHAVKMAKFLDDYFQEIFTM